MMRKNSADNFANELKKILFCTLVIVISSFSLIGFAEARSVAARLRSKIDIDITKADANSNNNSEDAEDDEVPSIWDSKPIEIDSVNIQVLDKISGKVLKKKVGINETTEFDKIEVTVKRAFKNAPEDSKEIYAFVEVKEYDKILFARWLFASSPSINLFEHPQYDVRVEF